MRRKEKALFDGVKRKRLGRRHSGLRPERSRRLLRGFWPGGNFRVFLTQLNTAVAKVGVPPGYSAVLFCCRTLAFAETPAPLFRYCRSSKKKKGVSVSAPSTNLPQLPMCGSKREEQGIPQFPQLLKPPYAVEWTRPTGEHPKPLVKGGKRHFKQSLKCRRQSLFLLHHQKAHSLFPLQEKENGGFALRRSRKPPAFAGTPSAPGMGAPSPPRQGPPFTPHGQ